MNCYTLCYLSAVISDLQVVGRFKHFSILLFSLANAIILEYHRRKRVQFEFELGFENVGKYHFSTIAENILFSSYKLVEMIFCILILARLFLGVLFPIRFSQNKLGLFFSIIYIFTSLFHSFWSPFQSYFGICGTLSCSYFGDFIRSFFEDSLYLTAAIYCYLLQNKEDTPPDNPSRNLRNPSESPKPIVSILAGKPLTSSISAESQNSSHPRSSTTRPCRKSHTQSLPLLVAIEALWRLWGIVGGIVDVLWLEDAPEGSQEIVTRSTERYYIVEENDSVHGSTSSYNAPSLPLTSGERLWGSTSSERPTNSDSGSSGRRIYIDSLSPPPRHLRSSYHPTIPNSYNISDLPPIPSNSPHILRSTSSAAEEREEKADNSSGITSETQDPEVAARRLLNEGILSDPQESTSLGASTIYTGLNETKL